MIVLILRDVGLGERIGGWRGVVEVLWLPHRGLELEMNVSLSTKEKRHSNQTWCR
jgi:hypothetical protein